MYSALKRDGQPLYRLARQGLTVERAPRALQIGALELLASEEPRLRLRVQCSSGTYVRVLGEDIARALGTCGRLDSLRRLYVEPFAAESMVSLPALAALSASGAPWPILTADRAVQHMPALQLTIDEARALARGQTVARALPQTAQSWRLYDPQGQFLGLGQSDAGGPLRVRRLFSDPLTV